MAPIGHITDKIYRGGRGNIENYADTICLDKHWKQATAEIERSVGKIAMENEYLNVPTIENLITLMDHE